MKKLSSILIAFALIISILCSCSEKQVDIKQVFDKINSEYVTDSGLTVVEDAAKLNRYYQIDEADVKNFAAEFSAQSSVFTEVVLIEATDKNAAANVADALNKHYESRLTEGKSYNPEAVSMLEKCSVRQNGVYVDLVIAENSSDILTCIDSYFK